MRVFWHLSLFNPGRFPIFRKINDGTIITHIESLGKPGKGRCTLSVQEE